MDVTIKDIAKAAEVSYASVSRALNGKKGVSEDTKAKILDIAKQLEYHPNEIARGLVKKQTFTLGLLIPDITNPFYPALARGVEDQAIKQGYSVFLCNTNYQVENERQYIQVLSERRADGLIISACSHETQRLEKPDNRGLPTIYVSNAPKTTSCGFAVVDNVRGGFLAAKHLIESGYDSLGFVGGEKRTVVGGQRLKGFRDALDSYGISCQEKHIRLGGYRQQGGYDLMCEIIRAGNPPRAVFAANDLLAIGAIQGIKRLGLRVPEDIAVVGFDDIEMASMYGIELTTIRQPKYEMGRVAVNLLLDLIEGDNKRSRTQKVILEPELVIRKTA